jgi:hypothetical protein
MDSNGLGTINENEFGKQGRVSKCIGWCNITNVF